MRVITMWSGPRNISTALMYSWRQRADTQVFDEPYYGRYLSQFDPGHPGQDEVRASQPIDIDEIIGRITAPGGAPLRYVKNIAHHLDALDNDPANTDVLGLGTNVLLIRHPAPVVASLTATLGEGFSVDITGAESLTRVLDYELAAGREPLVIDSADLLCDPEGILMRVCERLEIAFDEAMLGWPAGPKPEDGVWAKHWYHNAHASTGFGPHREFSGKLSEIQTALLTQCLPHYDRLRSYSIKDL